MRRRWRASQRSRGSRRRSTPTGSRSPGASCPAGSAPRTTSSSGRRTRGTRRSSRSSCSGSTTTATNLPGRLRRPGTASAARRSRARPSSSTGSAPTTAPRRSGSRRRTGSSGSRPTRSGCSPSTTSGPTSFCPAFRSNEARSFIAGGLQDFSISRAGQPWGVPIPWDPDQVAYVWADALVNYLSALTYARPGEDLRDRYWPAVRHLLGEGHPALPLRLLAGDAARGRIRGRRSSCSSTGTCCSTSARSRSRSATSSTRSISSTSTAPTRCGSGARARSRSARTATSSIAGLHERYERELGNDLGNLLSRTTAMIARYRGGTLGRAADDGSPRRRLPLEPLRRRRRRAARRVRHHRRARADLGGRARRSTGTSRRPRRGSSRRTRRGRPSSTRVLYDLVDGLRAVAVALVAYVPATAPAILEALGQPDDLDWDARRLRPHGRGVDGIEPAAAALPAARRAGRRGVIDTHAHLDACDGRRRRSLDRARAAGVTRVVTVGTGHRLVPCRARARGRARRRLRGARHRPSPGGDGRRRARRRAPRAARASRRRSRSGRRGSTTSTTSRRSTSSGGSSTAQLELADELGKPVVIHSRAADDDDGRGARARSRARSSSIASPSPALLRVALERGYYVSFAGNVTFPKAADLREAADAMSPPTASSPRPTARTSRPSPLRGRPNEPAYVVHTFACSPTCAARTPAELAAQIDANATAAFGLP